MFRLVCVGLLLVAAVPAAAQPQAGTVFIGAGALASIERSSRTSNFGYDIPDRDGTVAGGSLSMGVYLTPSVSARLEWSMTDWLEFRSDLGILPLFARPGLGAGVPNSLIAPQRFDGRQRTKAAFSLLGYHVGSRRASVEVLGGLGLLSETTRTSYDFRIALAPDDRLMLSLPFPRGESRVTEYRATGVVGLDASVALTDHATVVPQVRVYSSGGSLVTRPGVGIRWTF